MNRLTYQLLSGAELLLAGSVLYFSWIPDPSLEKVVWLPEDIGRWADHFSRMRTGVPLLLLGLIGGFLLKARGRPWKNWIGLFLVFAGLVTVAEIGQLFLPKRVFDWQDIAWGATGALLGLLPMACWLACEVRKISDGELDEKKF